MELHLEKDTHTALLDTFTALLDAKEFYDAHECLEAIWFPRRFEENNEIKLIKSFINASVCFELIKKNKRDASDKVWKNYLKHRPLLYKTDSPYLNKYHAIARKIEYIKNTM